MGVLAVHGACNHLAVDAVKFFNVVRELADLRWAHKCEVHGIEKEYHPFPLIGGQADFLEGPVRHQRHLIKGGGGKVQLCISDGHFLLVCGLKSEKSVKVI